MPIDALSVLCAQLTSDLFAIAKFLLKQFRLVASTTVSWSKLFHLSIDSI